MIDAASYEADRIGATQRALVAAGLRSEPEPTQVERMHAFEDIAKFLKALFPFRDEISRMMRPKRELRPPEPATQDQDIGQTD